MYIYLVERTDTHDYDEYDAIVVRARSATHALYLATAQEHYLNGSTNAVYDGFLRDGSNLRVKHIGTALPGTEEGLVLSSFNAG